MTFSYISDYRLSCVEDIHNNEELSSCHSLELYIKRNYMINMVVVLLSLSVAVLPDWGLGHLVLICLDSTLRRTHPTGLL
jgi:hypothetical protein